MSRFIEVFRFTGARMQEKGSFFALMFFVLGLGSFVVYFVVGWSSNIIAQVRALPQCPCLNIIFLTNAVEDHQS